MAANGIVVRALEIAGKKMLTPTHRGMFPDTPAHQLHTKIRVASDAHAETLLAGAWDHADLYFEGTTADVRALTSTLHAYTKGLLRRSIEHRPSLLAALLSERDLQ
jgi:hypothetical protein